MFLTYLLNLGFFFSAFEKQWMQNNLSVYLLSAITEPELWNISPKWFQTSESEFFEIFLIIKLSFDFWSSKIGSSSSLTAWFSIFHNKTILVKIFIIELKQFSRSGYAHQIPNTNWIYSVKLALSLCYSRNQKCGLISNLQIFKECFNYSVICYYLPIILMRLKLSTLHAIIPNLIGFIPKCVWFILILIHVEHMLSARLK